MGRCGNPYYSQLLWLKNIIKIYHKDNNNETFEYVILIKRNYLRQLHNFNNLLEIIKKFAKKVNLKLYIHDDSNLPSLKNQQHIFSKAKYIFGQSGAASIHLPIVKNNAWWIEFMNGQYKDNIGVCHIRIAYLLDINLIGLRMINWNIIDLKKIKNTIQYLLNY